MPFKFEVRGQSYTLTVLDDEGVSHDPTLLVFRGDEEEAIITAHLSPDAQCSAADHIVIPVVVQ